jgi:branched-chain amino acid transport system permease protein
MKIINFAHCGMMMLSMYVTYWLWVLVGIDPLFSLFIVIPVFFTLGWVTQKVVISPIMSYPLRAQMITTLGLLLVIEHLAVAFWTADFRRVYAPYTDLVFWYAGVYLYFPHILAFIGSSASCLLLYMFLKRTYTGVSIRATAQDAETAETLGIDTNNAQAITFGIGTACTAIGGTLVTTFYPFDPFVGGGYIIVAFTVIVLGGLGNFVGTFLSGLLIGVILSLFGFWTPESKVIVMLLGFLMVLAVRPEGLFRRAARR